jgi:predicted methyltransferase
MRTGSYRLLVLPLVVIAGCGGGSGGAAPAHPQAEHASPARDAHDAHGAHGPLGHRFEDPERWARVFDDPKRDAWQKPAEVVALLELGPGQVVADLGAGTGYFLPHLSPAVNPDGRVLALDIEPTMVEHMRERAAHAGLSNVEARVVPFDDPSLPAAGVDRVLVVNTWHHIPDRVAYVRKLLAGLRQGGRVVVVDFTMEAENGPPKQHRIPPDQVVRELEEGGLDASIVDETLPDQYVVIGRRP